MRIRIFDAGKGDCLLIETPGGVRVLADAGEPWDYRNKIAGALAQTGPIDLLYVSHIDQDHIGGVAQMLDDMAAWRAADAHRDARHPAPNPRFRAPDRPRPPQVRAIWHNSFPDQLAGLDAPIEDALAFSAAVAASQNTPQSVRLARAASGLATSMRQALRVSLRIRPEQLDIPLNGIAGGRLIHRETGPATIGDATLTVLGPTAKELEALRADWRDWVGSVEGRKAIEKERREVLASGESVVPPMAEIGDRSKVSIPNLASLMLLLEAAGRSVLLTGDGHAEDVLAGLEAAGRLAKGAGMQVDVLKIPHHGSEHNATPEMFQRVIADHYVFCANGAHENPDKRVIRALLSARRKDERPFSLWFSASIRSGRSIREREHLEKIAGMVDRAAQKSGGRITIRRPRGSGDLFRDIELRG